MLPGTLTGTEILLLYLRCWKRNAQLFAAGVLYLVQSRSTLLAEDENPAESEALSDCTVTCTCMHSSESPQNVH